MGKPLAEKLLLPRERAEFEPLEVEGSRFSFFKTLFSKSGKMAKINILSILFSLPAIIWFFYGYMVRMTYNVAINYSGNIGLGYSMVENAAEQGDVANFLASLKLYSILIPLIIVVFVGLGGAFYAMRMLAQGDERISKNFLKGVKLTFADFFLHGLIAGVAIFVLAMNFSIYDAYGVSLVWKIIGIIGAFLLLLFALCYLMYATTISTFYKANPKTIIKDSFLFIKNLPLQTVIFSVIGVVPVAVLYFTLPGLFLNGGNTFMMLITTVGLSLFLFLGIAVVVAAWTVYTDFVYELGFGAVKRIGKTDKKKQNKPTK